jgi:AcrR family transcriptional regulator
MRALPPDLTERLLAVADGFIAEPATVRVAAVADATGIPRATLYYYFSGQEDLLNWFLQRVLELRSELLAKALTEPGPPDDRLAGVLTALLRFIADHPRASIELLVNIGVGGGLAARTDAAQAAFHRPVSELLEEGRRSGRFRNVTDAEAMTSALYGAITFVGLHYAVADQPIDVEAVAAAVIPPLLSGLG